jgi:hypothetical protein
MPVPIAQADHGRHAVRDASHVAGLWGQPRESFIPGYYFLSFQAYRLPVDNKVPIAVDQE